MTLLLLLGAEGEQCRPEDVQPDDRDELRCARGCELLIDDDLLGARAAAAADLGRPRPADEARLEAACLPFAQVRDPLVEGVGQLGGVGAVLREERARLLLYPPLLRAQPKLHSRLKASDPPSITATATPAAVTRTMTMEMHATSG